MAVVSTLAVLAQRPRRAKNCAGAQEGSRRRAVDPAPAQPRDAAGVGSRAQPPLNRVGGLVGRFSPGVAPGDAYCPSAEKAAAQRVHPAGQAASSS